MTTWANEEEFYKDIYCVSDFQLPENTVKAKSLNKAEHTLYWYEESDDEYTSNENENSKENYHENMDNVTRQVGSVVGNFYNNEALESYLKSLQFEEQQAQMFLPPSLKETTSQQCQPKKLHKSVAHNLQESFKNFVISEPKTQTGINGYSDSSSGGARHHATTSTDQSMSSPDRKNYRKNSKQRKFKKSAPRQNDNTYRYRNHFDAFDKNEFPALG